MKHNKLTLSGVMRWYPVLRVLLAVLLLGGAARVASVGARCVLLFFGCGLALTMLFDAVAVRAVPTAVSMARRLASAVSMTAAAGTYLAYGTSIPASAFAWLILLWGVVGTIATLQHVAADALFVRTLEDDFRAGRKPTLPFPSVYVLTRGGAGAFFGRQLITASAKIIHRKYSRVGYLETFALRIRTDRARRFFFRHANSPRLGLTWIISDALQRKSRDFRCWLARELDAFIVLRESADTGDADFEWEAATGLRLSKGPTVEIRLGYEGKEPTGTGRPSVVEIGGVADVTMATAANVVAERVALTGIPSAAADAALSDGLRDLVSAFADTCLPPFADSYLRFRVSSSDVERFSSLIDFAECLVRTSAIVLAVHRFAKERNDKLLTKLGRGGTLGEWHRALGEEVRATGGLPDGHSLRNFWRAPAFETQVALVEQHPAIAPELREDKTPAAWSQMEWMNWLIKLRNATRGHGFMTETQVSQLWFPLHLITLQCCFSLSDLVRDAKLVLPKSNTETLAAEGWKRCGGRITGGTARKFTGAVALKWANGDVIALTPFVLLKNNDLLLLDKVNADQLTYLNYSAGTRDVLSLADITSPNDLPGFWTSVQGAFDDIAAGEARVDAHSELTLPS